MKIEKHCFGPKMIDIVPIIAIVFGSFIGMIAIVLVYAAYTEKKRDNIN